MFIKYQHLERFGNTEVQNIEIGEVYVFPKIDGTNASVWIEDGILKAGSRNRELSIENDNAGFLSWVSEQDNIIKFLKLNPSLRLFGEWLVPHSLKTYRDTAWRNFYVFDVCSLKDESEILHDGDSKLNYLHYKDYKPVLDSFGIEYIPPVAILQNGSYEQFVEQLTKNTYLICDGKGCGEGIVLKNYSFRNKYNRNAYAKIITSEFKEKHAREMGSGVIQGKKMVEELIVEEFITKALCEKVQAKIENETGWSNKQIPQLLHRVYHDLITEDTWEFLKKHKNPTINFGALQHYTFVRVKNLVPQFF